MRIPYIALDTETIHFPLSLLTQQYGFEKAPAASSISNLALTK